MIRSCSNTSELLKKLEKLKEARNRLSEYNNQSWDLLEQSIVNLGCWILDEVISYMEGSKRYIWKPHGDLKIWERYRREYVSNEHMAKCVRYIIAEATEGEDFFYSTLIEIMKRKNDNEEVREYLMKEEVKDGDTKKTE